MPRPPMQDRSKVYSRTLNVRLTKAERERWKAMAAKQGMTLSQWLRMVLDRAARTG